MKQLFSLFALAVIIISCKNDTKVSSNQIFKIEAAIEKDAKAAVFDSGDKTEDSLYNFDSHVTAEFFENDTLDRKIDTMVENLNSYYYWEYDTLHLLAHFGWWSTNALYARICGDSVSVKYLKAPHENVNLYRLQLSDSSTEGVEVPCYDYKLIIARLPDTVSKKTVFGYFSFKSNEFFRWYDRPYKSDRWADDHKKLRTNMAFYFRANYQNLGGDKSIPPDTTKRSRAVALERFAL